MKDWINFILMIVSGLCFVGAIVLTLFWPSVIPAFSTFTKLLILCNLLWVIIWFITEVFVRRY